LILPVTEAEAADSAELRLLGSPFIRLRINCVAAVNCGTYIGRLVGGEVDGAPAGKVPGAGLGVESGTGAPPFAGSPGASAPALGAGSDMLAVTEGKLQFASLRRSGFVLSVGV
jgi:hypothetical protein